jgi:DNA-binding GntR family transcriptional regulator
MVLLEYGDKGKPAGAVRQEQAGKLARIRLAGELFNGRYRAGESVKLSEIAERHELDQDCILKILREFETLGMVTLGGNTAAVFHSPKPKEMQEAYEIRAALEEVGGRAAARLRKGNPGK